MSDFSFFASRLSSEVEAHANRQAAIKAGVNVSSRSAPKPVEYQEPSCTCADEVRILKAISSQPKLVKDIAIFTSLALNKVRIKLHEMRIRQLVIPDESVRSVKWSITEHGKKFI